MWRGLHKTKELFRHLVKFEVVNGEKVSFWFDRWCLKVPLASIFNDLVGFSSTRNALVADNFILSSQDWFLGLE